MLSFRSDSWFRVKNRGFVASIKRLPDQFYEKYYDPSQLVGEEVCINDEFFIVTGVEKYAIGGVGPDSPYRFSCGLLVKES